MSRSYPIWNNITACIYKSSKSYGVKNTGVNNVVVGTSASNSHEFAAIKTTHRIMDNGDRQYRLYVDGCLIKCGVLAKGKDKLVLSDWVDLMPDDKNERCDNYYQSYFGKSQQ